jgi:hypothetical protein
MLIPLITSISAATFENVVKLNLSHNKLKGTSLDFLLCLSNLCAMPHVVGSHPGGVVFCEAQTFDQSS